MKARTSRSLLPLFSCSRISFRRSTASGAFESASVWFWHTRQRSSCERSVTRRSRTGSCASTGAANKSSTTSLTTLRELLDERSQLRFRNLRREGPDVLVSDDALAVDYVRLGHAVDAIVDGDAPVAVVHGDLERITIALE